MKITRDIQSEIENLKTRLLFIDKEIYRLQDQKQNVEKAILNLEKVMNDTETFIAFEQEEDYAK